MDATFAEIISAYSEVGILGLCAVLMIIMFYKSFKHQQDNQDKDKEVVNKKDKYLQDSHEELLKTIQKQNDELVNQMAKNNEIIMSKFVDKVTTHVPSPEENAKQTNISENIDKCLQQILVETKASRADLVQYHNGGRGINKQSFLKMSMTNEQIQLGVKSFMPEFRDQFRSVLAWFVKELNEKGYCYIKDVEDMKDIDAGMYEFMINRGIYSKFGIAIKGSEDYVIGFICLEYLHKEEHLDLEKINNVLQSYRNTIQALLTL